MAGPLNTNPLIKTYDELQRSIKRMESHLDMFFPTLSDDQKGAIYIMLEGMKKAIAQIPEEYRITRHFQKK